MFFENYDENWINREVMQQFDRNVIALVAKYIDAPKAAVYLKSPLNDRDEETLHFSMSSEDFSSERGSFLNFMYSALNEEKRQSSFPEWAQITKSGKETRVSLSDEELEITLYKDGYEKLSRLLERRGENLFKYEMVKPIDRWTY